MSNRYPSMSPVKEKPPVEGKCKDCALWWPNLSRILMIPQLKIDNCARDGFSKSPKDSCSHQQDKGTVKNNWLDYIKINK